MLLIKRLICNWRALNGGGEAFDEYIVGRDGVFEIVDGFNEGRYVVFYDNGDFKHVFNPNKVELKNFKNKSKEEALLIFKEQEMLSNGLVDEDETWDDFIVKIIDETEELLRVYVEEWHDSTGDVMRRELAKHKAEFIAKTNARLKAFGVGEEQVAKNHLKVDELLAWSSSRSLYNKLIAYFYSKGKKYRIDVWGAIYFDKWLVENLRIDKKDFLSRRQVGYVSLRKLEIICEANGINCDGSWIGDEVVVK